MTDAAPGRLMLPADFDEACSMPFVRTEEGVFHEVRKAARLAADLLEHGHPDDLPLAAEVIGAVVACQCHDEANPHHGNYRWMREDASVTDLNAAAFVCCAWLPARLGYEGGLAASVREAWDRSIRDAVAAIERLDVHPAYTNIAAMDTTARVLAGQALGDEARIERGHRRLEEWVAMTAADGHPFEFNAPTYTRITLRTLVTLARYAERPDTARLARAMAQRVGLSIALHLHPGTGRWAGPHGRAYRPTIEPGGDEGERAREALARPDVPTWLRRVRPADGDVVETASRATGQALVTHHHRDFAFGTATAAFLDQANRIVLHARDGAGATGVMYARFLTNERSAAEVRHATDRTRGRHLPDEGKAFVVQEGPRCLALYAPSGALRDCAAAATVLAIAGPSVPTDAVLWHVSSGAQRRLTPDAEIPDDGVLVAEIGRVRVAAVLLTRSQLEPTPATLVRHGGELRVSWNHYRGPRKDHWNTAWPGPYFQGPPVCGFFLEVASVDEHASAAAFAAEIERDRPSVSYDPPKTYGGRERRVWAADVHRNGASLGLSVEVLGWECVRRTGRDGRAFAWPAISSPQAASGSEGRLEAFGAAYSGPPGPAWLFGDPEREVWAAGRLAEGAGVVELAVPHGRIRVDAAGATTLVWDRGRIAVDPEAHGDASQVWFPASSTGGGDP